MCSHVTDLHWHWLYRGCIRHLQNTQIHCKVSSDKTHILFHILRDQKSNLSDKLNWCWLFRKQLHVNIKRRRRVAKLHITLFQYRKISTNVAVFSELPHFKMVNQQIFSQQVAAMRQRIFPSDIFCCATQNTLPDAVSFETYLAYSF